MVAAASRYRRVIQLGNQRRSWPNVAAAIGELQAGVIGRPYFAKTWYANNRPSIGIGKETAVPAWLDYDLWQGPAPRRPFKDPSRVTSAGGRYRYQDDQETPDTQTITLEFKNNTSILFEGRSCNGRSVDGSPTALTFYGEAGAMLIDGNAYTVYDLKNKVVKEVQNNIRMDALNVSSPAQQLDAPHMQNFLDGIRKGTKLVSDILGGHQSTLLCQLGNIALRTGRTLNIDPANGHILNDPEAMKYWSREYQAGWEPQLS